MTTELEHLAVRLREFARVRDWEQFHTPKNLVMALAGEVGELVAEFQWLTADESRSPDPDALARMRTELGDVTLYLIRLADVLGVDLVEAAKAKLDDNDRRYDAELFRGRPGKHRPRHGMTESGDGLKGHAAVSCRRRTAIVATARAAKMIVPTAATVVSPVVKVARASTDETPNAAPIMRSVFGSLCLHE